MAKKQKFADFENFNKHISQPASVAHNGERYFFLRKNFVRRSRGTDDRLRPITLDRFGKLDRSLFNIINLDGGKIYGDDVSGGDLYLYSTSHATKGDIWLDEADRIIARTQSAMYLDYNEDDGASSLIIRRGSGFATVLELASSGYAYFGRNKIGRTVDNDKLEIFSTNTINKGAKITLASASYDSGKMYLDYGDYTAAIPTAAKLYIRAMNNGGVTNAIECDKDGNVGIGTSPSCKLHAKLTSGICSAKIESDDDRAELFLDAASGSKGEVLFQHAGTTAWYLYSQDTNNFFGIYDALGLGWHTRFDQGGGIRLNFSTENLQIVDAGSTGATEQDWIQVKVGGVTGYIRVFSAK